MSLVLGVSVACVPLAPVLGYRAVSLVLLLVVLVMPLAFGHRQVFVAAGVAALAWNFLFIPPVHTLAIGGVDDILYWATFSVVTIVSVTLAARLRAREELALALFALTKDLSSAHSQDEVLHAATTHISDFFRAEVAVFIGEPDGDIMPTPHRASTWTPDASESAVAAWAYWNERMAGRSTQHRSSAHGVYVPMSGPRYPLGTIGVMPRRNTRFSAKEAMLLENFVRQIGLACERELLNDVNKNSVVVAESERLYGTLFNSISHELRTPLAAILGAAENLQGRVDPQKDRVVEQYVKELRTAAMRLDRLVANLLDMSRLESGHVTSQMDWADLRDVVSGACHELDTELLGRRVTIDLPDTLPLVKVDFGLLQQALMNIIHNAVVHTPPGTGISIAGRTEKGTCILCVEDSGKGIPDEDMMKIFEKFYRPPSTHSAGMGLGLPIARGFVEAQGGTVRARNSTHGGAAFEMTLPLFREENHK